jgi:hypothetical protein
LKGGLWFFSWIKCLKDIFGNIILDGLLFFGLGVITEILLKAALNTIALTHKLNYYINRG